MYDNNHYHEECLRCNSCGLNLTGPNQKRARRFKNHILCDLHFADVALMECSDFMQQLRAFKPQSLGCAVARRKSSTTLIFPLPPQACSGKCLKSLIPAPPPYIYFIHCLAFFFLFAIEVLQSYYNWKFKLKAHRSKTKISIKSAQSGALPTDVFNNMLAAAT